jgi:hypothetical protein
MRIIALPRLTLAVAALVLTPAPASAEVTRADITSRTDVRGGVAFGDSGAYELVIGRIHFALDPRNARNAIIVDLDKAPRNAAGKVEMSADLAILKPKDPTKGNATLLLDVVNRGRKTVLRSFNGHGPDEYGDGLLMRLGFTVVWVGWEFDAPQRDGAIRIDVPAAAGVRGSVQAAATPNAASAMLQFAELAAYAPVDATSPQSTLTVRDGPLDEPMLIDRQRWTLGGDGVTLEGGFEGGRIYELTFESANPPVAGLGFAAVRDTAAWIKYAPNAEVRADRALAFGSSQSGRFLRTLLYLGFNADERERLVFDGAMVHIAGASRIDLNRRWATPLNLGQFNATSFPFADAALRDRVTGATEGALDNPRARDFKPKIFYTNTGVEYWGGGRSAALVHSTPDGAEDLVLPDNERVYFLAGSQHGPGPFPPPEPSAGAQRSNPTDYWLTMRALLVAMDAWLRERVAPPPSRYPRLQDGTLVPAADVAFPRIPGVHSPRTLPAAVRAPNALVAQHGAPGTALPFLVPQTDADGLELAGIRLPNIAVPLATYTGWNFRNPAIGGADQLFPLLGSYIPFPATAAKRAAVKDPRAAIAERYASKRSYLDKVRAAAEQLLAERYLRAEDSTAVVERAGQHWDLLTK